MGAQARAHGGMRVGMLHPSRLYLVVITIVSRGDDDDAYCRVRVMHCFIRFMHYNTVQGGRR